MDDKRDREQGEMVIEHGPSCGTYKQRSIPAYIVTDNAVRWEFDRIAYADKSGGIELRQLRPDECVIAPGLVYRR